MTYYSLHLKDKNKAAGVFSSSFIVLNEGGII